MQRAKNWAAIIASMALVAVLVFGFANVYVTKNQEVPVVPTAAEIAALVVIPELPALPEYDTSKIDELWEGVYSGDIGELEDDAEGVAIEQFLEDNEGFGGNWSYFFEDDEVFDLVTDGVDCDGDCVVEYIKEYEDDREINVINLGLDDVDGVSGNDRLVELSTVIRVKVFTDEDDLEEYFRDKVYLSSVVTSDDGELEAAVAYTL